MPRSVRAIATAAAVLLVAGVVAVLVTADGADDRDVVADPDRSPDSPTAAATATPAPTGTPTPAPTGTPTTAPTGTPTPAPTADAPAPSETGPTSAVTPGAGSDADQDPAATEPADSPDGQGDEPDRTVQALDGDDEPVAKLPNTGSGTLTIPAGLLALAAGAALGGSARHHRR